MPKWNARFVGREVDAIGIFSDFEIEVDGVDQKTALLAIYETHEHLSQLVLTPVDGYPLECYGCGKVSTIEVFGLGNNRQCPDCGSYEVHSPDAYKGAK